MARTSPPAVLATLVLAGCGASKHAEPPRAAPPERRAAPPAAHVRHAHCPKDAANCAAATGRVIAVEAHDPDGDGDLHLVVLGGSVTFPGITVFDIEKAVRPRRVPRLGDLVSAAGPVYPGSYGQHQIQATELHVAHR